MKICRFIQKFEATVVLKWHTHTHTNVLHAYTQHPNLLPHIYITLRFIVVVVAVALPVHIAHHNKTVLLNESTTAHNVFIYTKPPHLFLTPCGLHKRTRGKSFFFSFTFQLNLLLYDADTTTNNSRNTHRMQTVN